MWLEWEGRVNAGCLAGIRTNERGGRGIMGIPYSRIAYRLVMGGDKREAERLDWGI